MLALVGLITVILLLGVITSRAMSPLVALIVVPVTAALIAGFGFKTEQFMLSGVQQTASVAAMFVFAILSRDISASWIGR
jgi:CitMHS family citrate-Mg2+:H+ or citrate-Ca2+:H+ symporter